MSDLFNPPAIVKPADVDLGALAKEINAEHAAAQRNVRASMEHGRRAGELLIRAKCACKHGEWLSWLKSNAPFSKTQAYRYIEWAKLPVTGNLEEDEREWRRVSGNDPTEDDEDGLGDEEQVAPVEFMPNGNSTDTHTPAPDARVKVAPPKKGRRSAKFYYIDKAAREVLKDNPLAYTNTAMQAIALAPPSTHLPIAQRIMADGVTTVGGVRATIEVVHKEAAKKANQKWREETAPKPGNFDHPAAVETIYRLLEKQLASWPELHQPKFCGIVRALIERLESVHKD